MAAKKPPTPKKPIADLNAKSSPTAGMSAAERERAVVERVKKENAKSSPDAEKVRTKAEKMVKSRDKAAAAQKASKPPKGAKAAVQPELNLNDRPTPAVQAATPKAAAPAASPTTAATPAATPTPTPSPTSPAPTTPTSGYGGRATGAVKTGAGKIFGAVKNRAIPFAQHMAVYDALDNLIPQGATPAGATGVGAWVGRGWDRLGGNTQELIKMGVAAGAIKLAGAAMAHPWVRAATGVYLGASAGIGLYNRYKDDEFNALNADTQQRLAEMRGRAAQAPKYVPNPQDAVLNEVFPYRQAVGGTPSFGPRAEASSPSVAQAQALGLPTTGPVALSEQAPTQPAQLSAKWLLKQGYAVEGNPRAAVTNLRPGKQEAAPKLNIKQAIIRDRETNELTRVNINLDANIPMDVRRQLEQDDTRARDMLKRNPSFTDEKGRTISSGAAFDAFVEHRQTNFANRMQELAAASGTTLPADFNPSSVWNVSDNSAKMLMASLNAYKTGKERQFTPGEAMENQAMLIQMARMSQDPNLSKEEKALLLHGASVVPGQPNITYDHGVAKMASDQVASVVAQRKIQDADVTKTRPDSQMRISLDSKDPGARYYTFGASGVEALKGVVPGLITPSGDPTNEDKFNARVLKRDRMAGGDFTRALDKDLTAQAEGMVLRAQQDDEQELVDAVSGADAASKRSQLEQDINTPATEDQPSAEMAEAMAEAMAASRAANATTYRGYRDLTKPEVEAPRSQSALGWLKTASARRDRLVGPERENLLEQGLRHATGETVMDPTAKRWANLKRNTEGLFGPWGTLAP